MEETGLEQKIVSYYWFSSAIRAEDVIWGEQKKDGKVKSLYEIMRNGPERTKTLTDDDDDDNDDHAKVYMS